jgi:hypothetical protein
MSLLAGDNLGTQHVYSTGTGSDRRENAANAAALSIASHDVQVPAQVSTPCARLDAPGAASAGADRDALAAR